MEIAGLARLVSNIRDIERSTKLAVWDWLFATAHLPPDRPNRFGLWGGAQFPRGFLAQQLYAFRRSPKP